MSPCIGVKIQTDALPAQLRSETVDSLFALTVDPFGLMGRQVPRNGNGWASKGHISISGHLSFLGNAIAYSSSSTQRFPATWVQLGCPSDAIFLGPWQNWKRNWTLFTFVWERQHIDLHDNRVTALVWYARTTYIFIAVFALILFWPN
jgi:hypothetical protein